MRFSEDFISMFYLIFRLSGDHPEVDRAPSLFGGVTTSGLSAAGGADMQTSLSSAPACSTIAFKD